MGRVEVNDQKLTIRLEKGRLVIEHDRLTASLLVRDTLQAEYFLGVPEGPKDFRDRLQRSSAALCAASIMARVIRELLGLDRSVLRDAKWRTSYAEGLEAGLRGEYRTLPGSGALPPDLKCSDYKAFEEGWRTGQGIFGAVGMAETGEDPRKSWQ